MEQEKKKLNLKIIIPIVIAIVVIVAVIIILSLTTKVFWNYFDYIDNGEFETAFEKAKNESERNSVIKANAIAYVTLSAVTSGEHKDLVKYENYCTCTLTNAWYDKDKNIVICLRSITTSSNYYLYFAYSESKKDYDFVCISKEPITIDNITLADSYTKGIKNSGYEKPIQKIAMDTMKKKLPEKLSEIMISENRVVRETNITDYLLTDFVKLNKNIELLDISQ